jgi:uncharacterized membrane protein YcgQ (UPF0703/DUF1980 family)
MIKYKFYKKLQIEHMIQNGLNLYINMNRIKLLLIEMIVMYLTYLIHSYTKDLMEITFVWFFKFSALIYLKYLKDTITKDSHLI